MQGVKLYYNVLEAMLTAEETRTQRTNFTSLLSSNSFHKCIAACAFELIVASYKMVRVPVDKPCGMLQSITHCDFK